MPPISRLSRHGWKLVLRVKGEYDVLAVLAFSNESGLLEGPDGPTVFGSRIDRYILPAGRPEMKCEGTDRVYSQPSTLSLRLENDVYAAIGGFV